MYAVTSEPATPTKSELGVLLAEQNACCNTQQQMHLHQLTLDQPRNLVEKLRALLTNQTDDDVRHWAAYSLGIIGGVPSVEVLRANYQETKDPEIKKILCLAMASTGTEADIQFLIDSLRSPDPDFEEWPAKEEAAYTLGVLKLKEAREVLRETADEEGPSSILHDSALLALSWIEEMRSVSPLPGTDRNQVVSAILECCFPVRTFVEDEEQRVWILENNLWRFTKLQNNILPAKPQTISIEVQFSRDGKRAVSSVLTHSSQFIYILRRSEQNWKVVGVIKAAMID